MHALFDNPWVGISLWVALHISDFALTIVCARMYQSGVRDVLVFEGSFELTPNFEKDIDALRVINPRILLSLLWGIALLTALWWLSRFYLRETYEFGLGAMILVQVAVHLRHARNYVLFRKILAGQGIRGRVEYARPAMLEISAAELGCFALVFLLASAVAWSPFLLGGAASCASHAFQHWRLARRHNR
jgi:hypothetical protein